MGKKYSKNYERDYKFYLDNLGHFSFIGTDMKEFKPPLGSTTTKRAFLIFDSRGKLVPCDDPELFIKLLSFKKGLNFWLKYWAEGYFDMGESIDSYLENFNGEVPSWVRLSFVNQIEKILNKRRNK